MFFNPELDEECVILTGVAGAMAAVLGCGDGLGTLGCCCVAGNNIASAITYRVSVNAEYIQATRL
jgi:hypothetical protein